MKRLISFVTTFAMIMTLFAGAGFVNAEDSGSITGQAIEYIEFGSYPQTEIVGEAGQSGVYGKAWATKNDYDVDETIYSLLQTAEFDSNNDVTIDSVKYHRIKSSDATLVKDSKDGCYSWADSDTYHYFRYDPIKWRVLDINSEEAYLLSDICLDDQKYNSKVCSITWENSTLREWLNSTFLNRAFSEEEQAAILLTDVKNENNIEYETTGGNDTQDKVYLLSESEVYGDGAVKHGFAVNKTADTERASKSSTYAKAMGIFSNTNDSYLGNCYWFLRSPGNNSITVSSVSYDGKAGRSGTGTTEDEYGIRPVLHIDLKSVNQYVIKYTDVELTSSDVEIMDNEITYDGIPKEPLIRVIGVHEGYDYTVEYSDNANIGTAKITLTGTGKLSGTITKEFAIDLPEMNCSGSMKRDVDYDLIEFGSYPQTEVVYDQTACGTYGKTFADETDYIEDGELYSALVDAEFDENGDTVINDVKYHRIQKSETTYARTGSYYYYDWTDDTDYHYFRYEPIKWRVLYINGNDAFLLADVCLDNQKYSNDGTEATWEKCSLRSWLNNDFMNRAFSADEKQIIKETSLNNADNVNECPDTNDRIFLLSKSEMYGIDNIRYGFGISADLCDAARKADSSTYTKAMGVCLGTSYTSLGYCDWWLRSQGTRDLYAACCEDSGSVGGSGKSVCSTDVAVRPAMHIDLSNSAIYTAAGNTGKLNTISITDISTINDVYPLNGSEATPKVTIGLLEEGTDYEVEYTDNDKLGIATVTVTGKGEWSGTISRNFAVVDTLDVSYFDIEILDDDICYYGEACCPEIQVGKLIKDEAYTVTYENNDKVGIGKITVEGIEKNGYTGSIVKYFKISKPDISKESITVEGETYSYTGSEIRPAVTVGNLTEGTDYTVEYSNNINVGTATVTITGIGMYGGTAAETFKITKCDISTKTITQTEDKVIYDGTPKTGIFEIDGLVEDKDYYTTYSSNTNAGTAKVTFTGKENCTGSATEYFTIEQADISGKTVSLPADEYGYTGTAITPEVTVDGLIQNTDYTVSYSNNVKMGTASVTVEGTGNYTGSITKTFTIGQADISEKDIAIIAMPFNYDGKSKRPKVVIDGLTEGKDFTVAYTNNVNAGEGKITVIGKGYYTGSKSAVFTIAKAEIAMYEPVASIKTATYTYSGEECRPVVSIEGLKAGIDYTVSYSSNTKCGKAKATVYGIGNYAGNITQYFIIKPAKGTLSKAAAGSKKITVTIKSQKTSGVTGYQIYYKKAGSSAKYVTTTSTSKALTGLTKGKKYTVKVRAYKTIDGNKVYGAYSSSKTVTVK